MKTQCMISTMAVLLVVLLNVEATAQNAANGELKQGLAFSIVVNPSFEERLGFSTVIPPSALYLEYGIAGFTSLGVSLAGELQKNEPLDSRWAIIGINARLAGYVLQAIEKFSGNTVEAYGLEPFVAVTYGTFQSLMFVGSEDPDTTSTSDIGFNVGTRWYPGNQKIIGILAEYASLGNTARGSSFNVGITLGR